MSFTRLYWTFLWEHIKDLAYDMIYEPEAPLLRLGPYFYDHSPVIFHMIVRITSYAALLRRVYIAPIIRLPNEIKWAYQRARFGISEADSWDLDKYLSRVICRGAGLLRNELEESKVADIVIATFKTAQDLGEYKVWYQSPATFDFTEFNERNREFVEGQCTMRPLTYAECVEYDYGWSVLRDNFTKFWS